ncbi:hypothetical protein [Labedaea rhizosphaerae]|uniref:Uncharacterized protein n=1 Tax=Labedaea rhizosphaerae TaxID=598644 RepID=A0A4R6SCH9_LABRH|nr:hypothetical protein [Labedaea rhizosphaerae]TDP97661.1 hypothetical protein EV186_103625 [Labedaea rhizosphaerae]
MSALLVVGVDPGQTTGIAALHFIDGVLDPDLCAVLQTSPLGVLPAVYGLTATPRGWRGIRTVPVVAAESFVVGRRASRSRTAQAGETARMILGALAELQGVRFVQHPAGAVKPWATDKRIEVAGLAELTTGMRHARDACRHALYAAVHGTGARDPLSRKEND